MTPAHPGEYGFSVEIKVTDKDLDIMNHVNNVVYVKWVQKIAETHWNFVAPEEIKKKFLWVVLRHEIDYIAPALKDETLTATTWVEEATGARSDRYVHITNSKTGKPIAKAKTVWCMLDAATLRTNML